MRLPRSNWPITQHRHELRVSGSCRELGFTLIELMITVAVAAVLISLAVPDFRLLIQNNRLSSATNDFVTVLNTARAEAIKRGTIVIVCRTDDPEANPPACQRGNNAVHDGNWSSGWVMYALPVDNLPAQIDYSAATDDLVRVGAGVVDSVRITSDSEGNQWLAYNPDGTLFESAEARYAICDSRDEASGRLIRIPLTGRPAIEDTTAATATDCSPT